MIVTNVMLLGICVWLICISTDLTRIARAIERLNKKKKDEEVEE